jgi:hypothetical protein
MNKPISAYTYLLLGSRLWALVRSDGQRAIYFKDALSKFLTDLEVCGFSATRAAAKALEALPIMEDQKTGLLTLQCREKFSSGVSAVDKCLDHESQQRLTIVLDTSGVSSRLTGLATVGLTEIQQKLLDETIRCIECGIYRAAVVMGWNLTYDYIRHWVYTNRRDEFNKQITKDSRFAAITDYAGFFDSKAPDERTFLDAIKNASILPVPPYEHLCSCLRQRNDYAHPNFKALSREQANAYIENLIAIIVAPPFPLPPPPAPGEPGAAP